jgi:hypothetical protein
MKNEIITETYWEIETKKAKLELREEQSPGSIGFKTTFLYLVDKTGKDVAGPLDLNGVAQNVKESLKGNRYSLQLLKIGTPRLASVVENLM